MSTLAFRLVAAQTADAITFLAFYVFVGAGTHAERNPVILALMAVGGIWAVAAVKVGWSLLASWRYERLPRKSRPVVIVMSVAAASGIAGAGFNLASIISSMRA